MLNIAEFFIGTQALGPGYRAAVWVQGCPFNCAGCISPEWRPLREANLYTPAGLAEVLLQDELVTGVTLSGGEPMLQAEELADLIQYCRCIRDIDVICFSGYSLDELQKSPPDAGVGRLLDNLDVLIDGRYVQSQHADKGLRGSRNQVIHYLSGRLKGYNLESAPRKLEVSIRNGSLVLIGIPTAAIYRQLTHGLWDFGTLSKSEDRGAKNYE